MTKKIFCIVPCAMLFALSLSAQAQQSTNMPRIGYLTAATPTTVAARTEAFRQGLRELGYVEGNNIAIEWRYADGKLEHQRELVADLVRLKVDIIVSAGPASTRYAKEATTTIPIVMTFDNDPVGTGVVASLARPGGNITGLSTLAPEISGKQLELLTEIIPKLRRVAVMGDSNQPGTAQARKEIEQAAGAFKAQVKYLELKAAKDIEAAFQSATKERVDAVLMQQNVVAIAARKQITDLAVKSRLPVMYWRSDFVQEGGLMSYGVSITDLDRRAATYVDKILKGRTPADLPVEQPIKFEFIINLKAAKQIGLTIPPNVLARADKVIK